MSINPTLADDATSGGLFPLPLSSETFVLKRDGIAFDCSLGSGHKLWGNGSFFLSSKRIVFIATEKSCRNDFKSFQVLLATMEEPAFKQPAFGANYLTGLAFPSATDEASALLGGVPARFNLTFNTGGCGTFLSIFYKLLKELKQANVGEREQAASVGQLHSVAYVDPSDPSTLYLSQPAATPGSQEDTKIEVAYEPGEFAEVKIIEGTYTGNWVKCRINGPGSEPGMYNIHVLPTTDFDNVGGMSDQDYPDIGTVHLRKAGDYSKSRPGPCGVDCAIQ